MINGAQALVKSLEKLGVTDVFGIPGGATLPLYDAMAESKIINHYLMRHEQCAAHAADGYARAAGKPGVCIATSGPGATNLVTGIANAYMDSIPLIAITGQVPSFLIGTDAFQEADITGITLPIVKNNYLVVDANDIADVIVEAFHIANTGRKGPVVIDIPRDVQQQMINFKFPEKINLPGYKPTTKGHVKQIKAASEAIINSKKPILYVGGGIIASGAHEELRRLAEDYKIFLTWTLLGKGAFPDAHELNLGMIGMHGTKASNIAVMNSDLIIAVGVRFDDRATGNIQKFAPHAKVIHIDIDPAEVSKIIKAHIPIVGDAKLILKLLYENLKSSGKKPDYSEWIMQVSEWKKRYSLKIPTEKTLKPQTVVAAVNEAAKGKELIVTTGVGQNQMWAAQYIETRMPRQFISSGGLGTMGFGMPAAIGAQVAKPGSLVIDIDGDGSFQMVLQDLGTIARYNLPIKMLILNNRYLGMVRQWQELFYKKRYFAVDIEKGSPNFEKLGEAYGIKARTLKDHNLLMPALREMISWNGPYILEVLVDEEENVFPMVAPGAGLDETLGVD